MKRKNTTKRALVLSILALTICVAMLVGTTFAWFTDSVTSANNIITSGNLDVVLERWNGETDTYEEVTSQTKLFSDEALWEPGYTEVAYLKVSNAGSLALKYQLSVNVYNEILGKTKDGADIKLSDYLVFKVVESDTDLADTYNRETAKNADAVATKLMSFGGEFKALEKKGDTDYVALIIYMPESVGNEANHDGVNVPKIEMGVNLYATQKDFESDSFGTDYDKQAPELTIEVTPDNIQDYLNGKYGSLDHVTLKLASGDYGKLQLGLPTKYEGSNTKYICTTHTSSTFGLRAAETTPYTTTNVEEFKAHLAEPVYHTTPKYVTNLQNLTIQGGEGVKIAGLIATSGHIYGDVYDYVRDVDYDAGSAYYHTLTMKNVTFRNVEFTGKIDINTSDADSVYDGITFDGCSFTSGGTASTNGAALRYYNEANNGKLRNLTVENSTFANSYQGIYAHHVSGIKVINNTFDTTGHNAIAIQSTNSPVNLKDVVISKNLFKNIGDRIIRFGEIAKDSNITLEYNRATNSGDEDGEVIRAVSIADGVKVTANYNDWDGGIVAHEIMCDAKVGKPVTSASEFKNAANSTPANPEVKNTIVMIDEIKAEDLGYMSFANDTVINGNGNSLTRETGNGNPLTVNTTNKVTFEDVKFETDKGGAVLATRKNGANIEVNDCVFQNNAAPSTGNVGVQVYAENVTMVFNNCTFNNMPVVTNSSYKVGIKLIFNNCTFNWNGDNCSGFIQIANNLEIDVEINNCAMNYTTNSQYTTAKKLISYNWPEASTIRINGLKVTGTRNNDKIWKIASNYNKVTITTTGELSYTFNGEAIDFAANLK